MTSAWEADASPPDFSHALVLQDSRRDHLRQMRFLVLLHSFKQFLDFATLEELSELLLENL